MATDTTESQQHPIRGGHGLRTGCHDIGINITQPFGEKKTIGRAQGVSCHLILNQFLHFSIPSEYCTQHLSSKIIVRQVGVVQRLWMAVWNVAQP
jgi:hypothetical protein